MKNLFEEFTKPNYEDWINQLIKDLKEQPKELIQRNDLIEELSFNSYQHQDSENTTSNPAFENQYVRQTYNTDNRWENLGLIIVKDEIDANKKALNLLNLGATALRFDLANEKTKLRALTKEIQLQYIETTFRVKSINQYLSIISELNEEEQKSVFFELELGHISDWQKLVQSLKEKQRYTLIANGYNLQQCGATTWQEIAYVLSQGHEYLNLLTNNGLSIDEAAACIHFNIGVGANYFYEIAKIRSLRLLWARIIEEYHPEHACSYNARITGTTGFTNKSLKDPHTNLLRQTTEAMSLAFSGVHAICVQPYDSNSTKGTTTLSTRMAINIPLILQEESYLDKVIDPLGGSYTIEYLTNEIADKAWDLFQKIEELGGIATEEAKSFITKNVAIKTQLRKERIAEKTDSLIGINIFPNPVNEENEWLLFEEYLGLKQLILEEKN
jgi:methylmalonyl-CoA mutase